MKNSEILNPNCSEEVFKLTGTLDEIKAEVQKMIDIVEDEYNSAEWSDMLDDEVNYDYKREEIRQIKSLDEFRDMIFPFTCNYETYFQPMDYDELIVATCNNHDWDNLIKENMYDSDGGEYYKYANYRYYIVKLRGNNWVYLEKEYEDDEYERFPWPKELILETADLKYLQLGKKQSWKNELNMKLRIENGKYHFLGEKAFELREIKNKKKLERIEDMVMVMKI